VFTLKNARHKIAGVEDEVRRAQFFWMIDFVLEIGMLHTTMNTLILTKKHFDVMFEHN